MTSIRHEAKRVDSFHKKNLRFRYSVEILPLESVLIIDWLCRFPHLQNDSDTCCSPSQGPEPVGFIERHKLLKCLENYKMHIISCCLN